MKSGFDAQKIVEMSTDEVEMVAVFIEKLNILNIVIYRPPGANGKNFSKRINELKEKIYKYVRNIHVKRFPYNNFLYPEID